MIVIALRAATIQGGRVAPERGAGWYVRYVNLQMAMRWTKPPPGCARLGPVLPRPPPVQYLRGPIMPLRHEGGPVTIGGPWNSASSATSWPSWMRAR